MEVLVHILIFGGSTIGAFTYFVSSIVVVLVVPIHCTALWPSVHCDLCLPDVRPGVCPQHHLPGVCACSCYQSPPPHPLHCQVENSQCKGPK